MGGVATHPDALQAVAAPREPLIDRRNSNGIERNVLTAATDDAERSQESWADQPAQVALDRDISRCLAMARRITTSRHRIVCLTDVGASRRPAVLRLSAHESTITGQRAGECLTRVHSAELFDFCQERILCRVPIIIITS